MCIYTRFSLKNVSTVVPACIRALAYIVALWQTLFLISIDCLIVLRISRSDLHKTQNILRIFQRLAIKSNESNDTKMQKKKKRGGDFNTFTFDEVYLGVVISKTTNSHDRKTKKKKLKKRI